MVISEACKKRSQAWVTCVFAGLSFGCQTTQKVPVKGIHQVMEARADLVSPPESPTGETTVIVYGTDEQPMTDVFPGHKFQFWLMTPAGKATGFLTQGPDDPYHPQSESCKSLGDDDAGQEFCEKKPSEFAKRCMRLSYDVLQDILLDPPEEWTNFKTKYGEIEFAGWMNDYESLGAPGQSNEKKSWFGTFSWGPDGSRAGDAKFVPNAPIQWASAIYPDGSCTTPSRGLFIRFLEIMEHCAKEPGPGCCGTPLANDPIGC
jgi:hypothetical protein